MEQKRKHEELTLSSQEDAKLEQIWQERDFKTKTKNMQSIPASSMTIQRNVTLQKSITLPTDNTIYFHMVPDGSRFIVNDYRRHGAVWDAIQMRFLAQVTGDTTVVGFALEQQRFALAQQTAAGYSLAIFTFDGSLLQELSIPSTLGALTKIRFAHQQSFLVGATLGERVLVWDLSTGHQHILPFSGTNIQDFRIAPNDSLFAVVDATGMVTLWETHSWRIISQFRGVHDVQPDLAKISDRISFTYDEQTLAVEQLGERRTLQLWDISALASGVAPHLRASIGIGRTGQIVLDGRIIADIDTDTIFFYDAITGAALGAFRSPDLVSLREHVTATYVPVALSPREPIIAIGNAKNGMVWLWDIPQQQVIASFAAYTRKSVETVNIDALINAIRWSSDGQFLITLGSDELHAVNPELLHRNSEYTSSVRYWQVMQAK